jgi:transcriptional regulator with XRE-family HTH domain
MRTSENVRQQEFAGAKNNYPVFRGLEGSSVLGKEIAAIMGVTPPTISKWRKGRSRVPADKLAFLTLLLAHWLEEMEVLKKGAAAQTRAGLFASVDWARECLKMQESINQALPPEAVLRGAHMFRIWWNDTEEQSLAQTKPHPFAYPPAFADPWENNRLSRGKG